jgi:flagellar motor switch protein FliM
LGRALKSYKDTLSQKEEDELLPQVIESIIRLREAQDTMRSWMDNFKKPEGVSADSMKSFYANQKSIMAGIGDMYLKSMAEAEAILPKKL